MGMIKIVLKLMNYDVLLLIVDEILVNCCCCCYEMCCWWIDAMSFHNYGLVMRIGLLLRVLVKLCWIVELCWKDVLISSLCNFEYLLSTYTCIQSLGTIWDVGRSKFGFLGEKGLKPVTFLAELMTVRLSEG